MANGYFGGYDEYPMYGGSEGYGAAIPDTAGGGTPDPYGAPPEGDYPDASSYAEAYDVDTPDVDATGGGLPGSSLIPTFGSIIPAVARRFRIGGPGGIEYKSEDDPTEGGPLFPRLPNLGQGPDVSGGQLPAAAMARGGYATSAMRSSLMKAASAKLGFRLTWKKLAYLLTRFGIGFVQGLTGLDASSLLWLWMTRPKRGRRGPFFRTVVKRIRRGRRYEAMMRHWASKAHVHRGGGGYRRAVGGRRRRR